MTETGVIQDGRAPRRVTLITGASGGIGADLARVFARHGHDLALVARSRGKLEALADEIAASGRPRPLLLVFDLIERGAAGQIAAALDAAGATPEILVNNAGFGLAGEAAGLDPAEQLAIVDLNIRAVVEITLCFLPAIRAARGKILNVASIAAYFPGGPGMAAYYASKSFVLSFSLALSQELHSRGVTVSALCPGYTKTGFQARAGFGPNMDFSRLPGSTAMEVAEAGYAGLIAGRREIVPGFLNKFSISLLPFLPKALILAVISRLQQNRAPHRRGRREREGISETGLTQDGRQTRRVTVITGASGGIGAGLARVFARHGHDLALIDCNRATLEALADEIAASGRPRPLVLVFDLIEQGAVARIAAAIEAAAASPEILVNNAGFGLVGEAAGLDPAEQLAIIDLNIRVVVEITLCFLPSIRAARGKILNVASISAYFPGGPGMAAYYASKSFILSFSLALSRELNSQGVTVSALCPGLTKTGFQARAGFGSNIGLARLPTSTAMEVAEGGYAGLIGGRREIVPGFLNKLGIFLLPSLPKALILTVISRLQQNGASRR